MITQEKKSVIHFDLILQVFVTVVIFGLFHGLVYLPVILSWVGPTPYDTAEPVKKSRENTPTREAGEQDSNLLDSAEDNEKTTVQMNGFIKVKKRFNTIVFKCKRRNLVESFVF